MRERIPLFAGLVVLALAVALGSVFIANGIRDRNRSDVITVTGSAKQRIASDYVVWDASLASRQPTATAALKELAGWTRRTQSFFRAQGVTAGELALAPIAALSPGSIDDNGTRVKGYLLTRTFEIRSARVGQIASLAERSSVLLAQGVPLAAGPPQYVYTKLSSLRPQLLAAATEDARRRARVIVSASGAKLGNLRGVDVGVFQVTAPNSTQVSDYGEYDTTTLRKDVTAVVNVTFALGG
ncbi:MAG: uncharacterized protein QOF43_497 [Gaiellaceae bacterium]|nr:uncharacterized protein [Gaiellaceae bacterium]